MNRSGSEDWVQPVVCLDMAGTTVSDGGAVNAAFQAGLDVGGIDSDHPGRAEAMAYVAETMGQSKLEVFRHILGDDDAAARALAGFEERWDDLLSGGVVTALPGAEASIARLREQGWKVALLTGFSVSVRDALIDHLGWRSLADLALCPAEAGRGRPWGDMVWEAARRLGASSMAAVAVVGDTPSDMVSGVRSGAGTVVGVLTGNSSRQDLDIDGVTAVVASVREATELILTRRPR
jgi:phosphoglycolate phosphatase